MKLRAIPVVLTVLALTLTGCTASGGAVSAEDAKKAGCEVVPSGAQSNSIKVTGDFGKEPEVKFDTPLKADGVQRTILTLGEGDMIVRDDVIKAQLSLYNGTSGKKVASEAMDFPLKEKTLPSDNWFKLAECMPVGSRAVTTMSASDLYGEAGNENMGLKASDSVVLVIDAIKKTFDCNSPIPKDLATRAVGESKALPEGFPTVTLADNGEPTITFPGGFAPSDELKIADSISGSGEKVQEGDCVTLQYKGVNQATGETFDASWTRGEPSRFPTSGVIAGFSKGLVGQTVGSQVVILIGPADGYGAYEEGKPNTGYIAFVVDILATNR